MNESYLQVARPPGREGGMAQVDGGRGRTCFTRVGSNARGSVKVTPQACRQFQAADVPHPRPCFPHLLINPKPAHAFLTSVRP